MSSLSLSPSASSYRIVVVGATSAGKSGLTEKFVLGTFVSEYGPTIDEIYSKKVEINAQSCALNIVDVSGLAEYNTLAEEHMKSGDGFLLVYSINSRITFTHAVKVRASILRVKNIPDIPIVLVGHKCDLESERVIPTAEGQRLATEWDCGFMETSAKENKNISEVFIELIQRIEDWKIKHPPVVENSKRSRSSSRSWRRSSQLRHSQGDLKRGESQENNNNNKENKGTACVLL